MQDDKNTISQQSFMFFAPDKTPVKRCTGHCGQEYPATTEYWHRNKQGKYRLQPKCKNCIKEYRKEYYHRPEVKEHEKQRVEEYNNRPDVKERRNQRSKERNSRPDVKEKKKEYINRPEVKAHKKEYDKEWRKEYSNRPDVKAHTQKRTKEYTSRSEVKETLQKYNKEYRKSYVLRERVKEQRRSNGLNREARKKSIQGIHTPQQIEEQLKRQRHKCYYCHLRFKKQNGKYIYHIEHTFPLSRVAGTDIPANSIDYLVLACPSCNTSKGDKFPWEWFDGGRLL